MKLLISFSGECAMKKTISLFFGLLLLPTGLYAGESSLIFDDSSSFQTALSLKLGHAMGEMEKPNKGGVEKGTLCESDADCSSSEKCKGNTCVNVCDPNPCSSGYCLDEGNHSYSCVACLNDDHCSADKKCSGNACVDVCTGNNCTQQSKLCSSNGNHGYLCYGCTSDAACANDEFCDTTTKTCRTLCPDSCEGNLICEITGSHEAKCTCQKDEDCPEGYTCDQETKQCVAADCAGMLLASRDDVAVAIDAASFSTAMSSGKNIIAVTENLTVSSAISLGSKKLVGPKYFSDIPVCKETNTPTLTASAPATISNGEISTIDLKFTFNDSSKSAVSGAGTITDATISSLLAKNVVDATGNITLAGSVELKSGQGDGNGYVDQGVLATTSGSVEIKGTTTLSGKADRGLQIGNRATVTVASGGTLVFNIPNVFIGIDIDDHATFTANGPVKFEAVASSAVGYIAIGAPTITLNANGNYIKTSYTGFNATAGSININGSTTIECFRSSTSSSCTAIDSHETYSNSVNSTIINAPVTLVNFNKPQGSEYPTIYGDSILEIVGGTLKINSTIESKAGYGKVLTNGENMSMGPSGAILGASYLYGRAGNMSVSAGARIKLGGVCKKAVSSGKITTVTYDKAATSASTLGSPFTGGC